MGGGATRCVGGGGAIRCGGAVRCGGGGGNFGCTGTGGGVCSLGCTGTGGASWVGVGVFGAFGCAGGATSRRPGGRGGRGGGGAVGLSSLGEVGRGAGEAGSGALSLIVGVPVPVRVGRGAGEAGSGALSLIVGVPVRVGRGALTTRGGSPICNGAFRATTISCCVWRCRAESSQSLEAFRRCATCAEAGIVTNGAVVRACANGDRTLTWLMLLKRVFCCSSVCGGRAASPLYWAA